MNRGWIWIGIVVGMLVVNALAVILLVAWSGDTTPRVLPDYYPKAIAWDDEMAARRASLALGWAADASLDDAGRLEIAVADATGAPLPGATVTAHVRHRSRADEDVSVALGEAAPGRYAAAITAARPGLYQVDVEVIRGASRFVTGLVVERGIP